MAVMGEIRRRARLVAGPLLGAAIAGYFGYHAVQGERGLIAWWRVTQQIAEAEATLAVTGAERAVLERRVGLLRPDRLDPDMLDERARATLDLARPDEVIILRRGGEDPAAPPDNDAGLGDADQGDARLGGAGPGGAP